MKKFCYIVGALLMLILIPWLLLTFFRNVIPIFIFIVVLAVVVDRIDRKPRSHEFRYYEREDRFKGALNQIPYRPSRTRLSITLQEIPPFEMDVPPQEAEVEEEPTVTPAEEAQPTAPTVGEPITLRPHRPSAYVYHQEGEDVVYFTTKKEVTCNPFFRMEETSDDQI